MPAGENPYDPDFAAKESPGCSQPSGMVDGSKKDSGTGYVGYHIKNVFRSDAGFANIAIRRQHVLHKDLNSTLWTLHKVFHDLNLHNPKVRCSMSIFSKMTMLYREMHAVRIYRFLG